MRVYSCVCSSGLIILAASALGAAAGAQEFVAPANSLSFEDTGTLEAYQQGYIQIRDSKTELWLLQISAETKVSVDGEAEVDYLRPGLNIEFSGAIDKKFALEEPIDEIEIITSQGKSPLGLFATGDDGDILKPVRNPGAGTYRIKGKLASFKGGELTVAIGSRRITGSLAEEVKIKFHSTDPSMADIGDAVKVKAWYYDNSKPVAAVGRSGKALAEEISITLAKPLAPTGKKSRQAERRAKVE